MIKAFQCVRQGCLHVQSEACLTQEKVPYGGGGEWGSSESFWKEKVADKRHPPSPPCPTQDFSVENLPPILTLFLCFLLFFFLTLPIVANENVQRRVSCSLSWLTLRRWNLWVTQLYRCERKLRCKGLGVKKAAALCVYKCCMDRL